MKKQTNLMTTCLVTSAIILSSFAFLKNQDNKLTEKEKAGRWQLLFDGQSTAGWHLYNKPGSFTVWKAKNGELFCDPNDQSGASDLVTDKEYKNYDLKFDWKLPKSGN
ncbi:MAG: DUF1080 domain-containing protein, partial [Bacteroidetes bacterium]|nr:DUF1080 domain-containing protein [Bacteroidota bacterium]